MIRDCLNSEFNIISHELWAVSCLAWCRVLVSESETVRVFVSRLACRGADLGQASATSLRRRAGRDGCRIQLRLDDCHGLKRGV